MSTLTKKRKEALAKFDVTKVYSLQEATEIVKQVSTTKFDATVDIAVRLGVDPKKSTEMVRGVVSLPHGTGRAVNVLVLADPAKCEEALAAGADMAITAGVQMMTSTAVQPPLIFSMYSSIRLRRRHHSVPSGSFAPA